MPALSLLLSHGAPDFDEPCIGIRPLHLALQSSNVQGDVGYRMVQSLLQHGAKPGICLGDLKHASNAPLHDAAVRGNAATMQLLLEHGADADARDASGRTALHMVAENAPVWNEDYSTHKAMFELLLLHGSNPFQKDVAGRTPQHCTTDAALLHLIARAEKNWNKSELLCALKVHKQGALFACLEMPEILSSVGVFL